MILTAKDQHEAGHAILGAQGLGEKERKKKENKTKMNLQMTANGFEAKVFVCARSSSFSSSLSCVAQK